MTALIAAAAFFVLIHLLIAGTKVRDAITGRIGEGPYAGLFSLASIGGLIWLGWTFAVGRGQPWNEAYWTINPATRHIQIALQLVAMFFIVSAFFTPNPTSVRQEGALDRPDVARAMLRVTRHPFLWGVAIWSVGHLLVNGDRASIVLFGSLLILAVFGTSSIDAKRRRKLGDKWDAYAAQTSNVPFAAILAGRQKLSLKEIGVGPIAAAIAVWGVLLFAHPRLFGVPAIPALS